MLNGLSYSTRLTVWKPENIWSVSNINLSFMANSYVVTRRLQISVTKKTKPPIFKQNWKSRFRRESQSNLVKFFFLFCLCYSSKIKQSLLELFQFYIRVIFVQYYAYIKSNIKQQLFFLFGQCVFAASELSFYLLLDNFFWSSQ